MLSSHPYLSLLSQFFHASLFICPISINYIVDRMLDLVMESLLCDEMLFDMSPNIECDEEEDDMYVANGDSSRLHDQTDEKFEQAFEAILEKEVSYMPCSGYVDHVDSNPLIRKERAKALCWFIKSQRRLGFSLGTIFNAANYLDRFISSNKCQGWNIWMFELLFIACLSVAAKFNETNTPPLSEFQADDDLEHCFEWKLIQRMELTLLKVIGWRLTPTTPFSYMEMLTWSLRSMNSSLSNKIIDCITELLIINALLDYKLLEFRPFTIAMSAIRFVSEELLPMNSNAVLQHFNHYWNFQDYQGELLKCQEIMSKRQPIQDQCLLDYHCCNNNNCCGDGGGGGPTSPITVLFTAVDNDQPYTSKKRYLSFVTQAQICTQITSNDFNPSKRMKKEGHPPA